MKPRTHTLACCFAGSGSATGPESTTLLSVEDILMNRLERRKKQKMTKQKTNRATRGSLRKMKNNNGQNTTIRRRRIREGQNRNCEDLGPLEISLVLLFAGRRSVR